jgi:hypothetical protein
LRGVLPKALTANEETRLRRNHLSERRDNTDLCRRAKYLLLLQTTTNPTQEEIIRRSSITGISSRKLSRNNRKTKLCSNSSSKDPQLEELKEALMRAQKPEEPASRRYKETESK